MSYQSGELQPVTMHLYLPHKNPQCNAIFFFPTWLSAFFQYKKRVFMQLSKEKHSLICIFPKKLFNSIMKNIYPNISSGIFRQIIINKTLITLSKFSIFLRAGTPLFSCFKKWYEARESNIFDLLLVSLIHSFYINAGQYSSYLLKVQISIKLDLKYDYSLHPINV